MSSKKTKHKLSAKDRKLLAGNVSALDAETSVVTATGTGNSGGSDGGWGGGDGGDGGGSGGDGSSTSRTTPEGHKYTYKAKLSNAQLDAADKIVDYAFDHGFKSDKASLAALVAYAESSLGLNTSAPSNSTATGLYQYNVGTWNDRHPDLDRNSESDQITAFFEDLSQLEQQYSNGQDASGNSIPSSVNFPDYVYTKFHYGWYSQNYTGSDVTSYFDGKAAELGLTVQ